MDTPSSEPILVVEIPGFETYGVSNLGEVYNLITERMLVQHENQYGDMSVVLRAGNEQHRRSVKVLVADAFVPGKSARFNTPVIINGDKKDLRADNICWRPRWFAWSYSHQFKEPKGWFFDKKVREIVTGIEYDNVLIASMASCVLCDDILLSIYNETRVWPTGGYYEYVE